MRVLLICVPRTGSSSFIKALSKSLKINHISIPDSFNLKNNKAFIDSILNKDSVIFRISPIHNVGFDLLEFCSFFDKVILLSRLDDKQHYKSIVNLYYKENILKFGTKDLYDYNDIPQSTLQQIKQDVNYDEITNQKKQIEQLGISLNQKVLYYEDIFYSDTGVRYLQTNFEFFDTSTFLYYLSQTKKLSITREKSLI